MAMNALQKALVEAGLAEEPKPKRKRRGKLFNCRKCGTRMTKVEDSNIMFCEKCGQYFLFDSVRQVIMRLDYEDEYSNWDEEERFHKIAKKKNKNKTINKKAQIRQKRREKDKNREEINKQEKYLTDKQMKEKEEEEWEDYVWS